MISPADLVWVGLLPACCAATVLSLTWNRTENAASSWRTALLVGYVVGRISTRLVTEHPAVKAGLVLCAALADGLLFTVIQYVQEPDLSVVRTILGTVIPGAFYVTLLTPVVFLLLGRLFPQQRPIRGEFD